MSYQHTWR